MTNSYDVGDLVRVQATFAVSGVAADPTTVTLKVKDPAGNTATYTYALGEVTKNGTGVYYKDVSIDESGMWVFQWTGTGACQAVEESEFYVRKAEIT